MFWYAIRHAVVCTVWSLWARLYPPRDREEAIRHHLAVLGANFGMGIRTMCAVYGLDTHESVDLLVRGASAAVGATAKAWMGDHATALEREAGLAGIYLNMAECACGNSMLSQGYIDKLRVLFLDHYGEVMRGEGKHHESATDRTRTSTIFWY